MEGRKGVWHLEDWVSGNQIMGFLFSGCDGEGKSVRRWRGGS